MRHDYDCHFALPLRGSLDKSTNGIQRLSVFHVPNRNIRTVEGLLEETVYVGMPVHDVHSKNRGYALKLRGHGKAKKAPKVVRSAVLILGKGILIRSKAAPRYLDGLV